MAEARTNAERIPSNATSSPLITEVTRNETPDAVPTRPLARSRTVLRHQQRDEGGQRDAAQVAGDHAQHQHDHEGPQHRTGRVCHSDAGTTR